MTKDEFYKLCPHATWPDELSHSSWQSALNDIAKIVSAAAQMGLNSETIAELKAAGEVDWYKVGYWQRRSETIEAATIERCAQVAEDFPGFSRHTDIAAAIRSLAKQEQTK